MAAKRRTPRPVRERISHRRARFLAFKTAEGQATERELRLALAHLRECPACAEWVRELGATIRLLRRGIGASAVIKRARVRRPRRDKKSGASGNHPPR